MVGCEWWTVNLEIDHWPLTIDHSNNQFFQDQICACFVAEKDNTIIGIALYYISYSTWRGRSMYLEDLYVQPKHRGEQLGYLLFELVREEAIRLNCKRMDWQVLDWNEPAIKFYEKLGAELDGEWLNGRLYFDWSSYNRSFARFASSERSPFSNLMCAKRGCPLSLSTK